jgi:hypothetical protein
MDLKNKWQKILYGENLTAYRLGIIETKQQIMENLKSRDTKSGVPLQK